MKNRILLFVCSVIFFGSSCNSDDDDNVVLSGFDRMVDKNYRITDLLVESRRIVFYDSRDLLACELDDTYRFESSGTASTRSGALKCNPTEPNEELYFWTLISNDTKLIIDRNGLNVEEYDIVLNDGIRLVLIDYNIEDIDNDGQEEEVQTTTTYTRN